jgi:hypothetical protein
MYANRNGAGGGIGYSGSTTCASGYTCTVSNSYYSQCLPGTGSGSGSGTGSATTTTAPSVGTAAAAGNPFASVALYANP